MAGLTCKRLFTLWRAQTTTSKTPVPQEHLPFSTRVREAFDFVFLHQTPLRLIHIKLNRYGCLFVHKRMDLYICPLHFCPLVQKYLKANAWCWLIQRIWDPVKHCIISKWYIIITCHLKYAVRSFSPHDFFLNMLEMNANRLFDLPGVK